METGVTLLLEDNFQRGQCPVITAALPKIEIDRYYTYKTMD